MSERPVRVRSHRDRIVWQRAMELMVEVHRLIPRMPSAHASTLRDQLSRSVSSVAANIAEGAGRLHRGDYLRFISIARGSLMETATHVEIAVKLGYLRRDDVARVEALSAEVLKMLTKLGKVLRYR